MEITRGRTAVKQVFAERENSRVLRPRAKPEKSYCQILIIEKSTRKLHSILWEEIVIGSGWR